MKALLIVIAMLLLSSMNYVSGQDSMEIDTLSHQFVNDSGLNDGGGCWYAETDQAYKKGTLILVTENDKQVTHAMICINGVMMKFKRDSMQSRIVKGNIQISATTENISFYSNSAYLLTVDIYTQFEDGKVGVSTGTMKVKEIKSGRIANKSLTGNCGAN